MYTRDKMLFIMRKDKLLITNFYIKQPSFSKENKTNRKEALGRKKFQKKEQR